MQLRDVGYLKLSNEVKCSGYFDDVNRKLVVAAKAPKSLEILVHEYAHLTQWQDNCRQWKWVEKSMYVFDAWLSGKRVRNLNHHIDRIKYMELDNEKRSVELIKKYRLPIDLEGYIKRANSYVYFYNYIKKTRKWSSPDNSPYKNERIVEAMPPRFLTSYTRNPKYVDKIFEEEGI